MIYISFFCAVTLTIYSLFAFQEDRKKHIRRRMSTFIDQEEGTETVTVSVTEGNVFQRLFAPVWKEFKRSFKRRMPGEKVAKIEMLLLQAGSPFGMTPVEYRLFQIALFLLLPLLFGSYAILLKGGLPVIILAGLVGIGAAVFIPPFYIKKKIQQRSRLALRELPDVLDLLTVSLEAGLGFDSALSKLISKKEGILASEFHRCLEEIRLGKTRREALTGVKDRLVVDEIKVLISSILQAEKLGIGMVQVMRVQSQEVREQRKQRAEEEAMKAPIKMLFPLVLFIFPSLFIVLLGPAIIQFIITMAR
ncbi:type II secretion system F family protein [Caldalkalibacillus mannanilyticus]|uniref:type II secretion system F family protein n=1 Tax=Caldalkalibacillus mannanilyticus TaxID=1418 RepID=UPI00046A3AE4|nr:type II secretion system F family protein [Caldalkalibacillus mannanilyticus]